MKNAILAASTLCSILMIWFINKGMDTLNNAQEDSMGEVNEWMEEIVEKEENMAAEYEAKYSTSGTFSERMLEISRKQESISTDMTHEFIRAVQDKMASDAIGPGDTMPHAEAVALYDSLIRRQRDIIDELSDLTYDLSDQTQGIADYRLIQALESISNADPMTHLDNIKTKLLRRQFLVAAESSKTWAEKMRSWTVQLQTD